MIRFIWDLYLYRNLPKCLPTVSTTFSTMAPFLSILFFQWSVLTLAVMIVLIFMAEKISQRSLISSQTGIYIYMCCIHTCHLSNL
jgi:hypothetical protein